MKFSEKLATLLTPEWRNQYINYEELKNMLVFAVESAPSDPFDLNALRSYNALFDDTFFRKCEEELEKVNTFFAQKMAEANRKYHGLQAEVMKHVDDTIRKSTATRVDLRSVLTKNKAKELKFSCSEFYLSLVLLQNYQTLNQTGFRKILKKHDKLLRSNTGLTWFQEVVENAPFRTNNEISKLIHNTEEIFINNLEGGDRSRAMKRLRVPPLEEQQHPWTTFRLGLFSGLFFTLCIVIIISFQTADIATEDYVACLDLFRGPLFLIIVLFLYSLNVVGWRSAGVNHILIFEMEPRSHLKATQIMEMAAAFGVVWALNVLGFIYASELEMPPYVFPIILVLAVVGFLVNPLPIFHYSSRMWLLNVLGRTVAAPYYHVGFAEFWLSEQLLSLVVCLVDHEYILCFYLTNWNAYKAHDPWYCTNRGIAISIICCLPAWFRLAQCIRRYRENPITLLIVNGMKYVTTFPVVIFTTLMVYYYDPNGTIFDNPFAWSFFLSATVSSSYFYIYDIIMDFGLFAKSSGENKFLREQIVYARSFYYFAIIENFVLRFFWIIEFILVERKMMSVYNVQSMAGCLEIFRRYIWNYFRLENEHFNNVGQYRAVRDISVVPIDTVESQHLVHMMDTTNGVTNRSDVERKSKDD